MSSTVTTRPTHYEVLGLAPTASRAEVTRAFTVAAATTARPVVVPIRTCDITTRR